MPRRCGAILLACSAIGLSGCATGSAASREFPEQPRANFVVPAIEIVGFQAALNVVDRRLYDDGSFDVNAASIRRNLRRAWVIDDDGYEMNQFLHPYQGATYHTLARSAGLNYWQASAYTFAASALWEIAGETTSPSKNDQIATGIAGSFFGETLFRASNLLIDKADGRPGPGRTMIVALLSPATAFNRILFGDRFDAVMPTYEPMYDTRFQIGTSGLLRRRTGSTPAKLFTDESLVDVSLEYGLPGQPGYTYHRPFDYFTIRATGSSENGLESVTTHGLLAGRSYDAGNNGHGVWGVFGVYDYLSPNLFRVSTTAVSVGTVTQWWSRRGVGVKVGAHGGIGWAAGQTLGDGGGYHYGLAPQAAMALRLTGGDRVSLDVDMRGYMISDIGGYPTPGDDVIVRGDVAFGLRLASRHAVSIRYLFNQRVTALPDLATGRQRRETIGIFYTLLGPHGFGASRWKQ